MSATKATLPNLKCNKILKVSGRRQGPDYKQYFKEGLVPIFDDASNTCFRCLSYISEESVIWQKFSTEPSSDV